MSEAIAFIGGAVAMMLVWFWDDLKNNPYMRGYHDGVRDGIAEVLRDFPELRERREE